MVVSKAKFAEICGVSAAAVSQWVSAGKIGGSALIGTGRSAKIDVEKARSQLAKRLDPGQALGNGKATKLKAAPALKKSGASKKRPEEPSDPLEPSAAEILEALDYAVERAGLVREQRIAQQLKNEATRGEMINAKDAELRWADEMIKLRARMLAVSGDLPQLLHHLSPHDVLTIDRAIRDAMHEAAAT